VYSGNPRNKRIKAVQEGEQVASGPKKRNQEKKLRTTFRSYAEELGKGKKMRPCGHPGGKSRLQKKEDANERMEKKARKKEEKPGNFSYVNLRGWGRGCFASEKEEGRGGPQAEPERRKRNCPSRPKVGGHLYIWKKKRNRLSLSLEEEKERGTPNTVVTKGGVGKGGHRKLTEENRDPLPVF